MGFFSSNHHPYRCFFLLFRTQWLSLMTLIPPVCSLPAPITGPTLAPWPLPPSPNQSRGSLRRNQSRWMRIRYILSFPFRSHLLLPQRCSESVVQQRFSVKTQKFSVFSQRYVSVSTVRVWGGILSLAATNSERPETSPRCLSSFIQLFHLFPRVLSWSWYTILAAAPWKLEVF